MRLTVARVLLGLALLIPVPAAAGALNPGAFSLGDFQVWAAATYTWSQGPVTDLAGLDAVSLQASLTGGSGCGSVNVYIQSSIDQGSTWFDIANIVVSYSAPVELINLSGLDKLTTPAAPNYLSLSNNTTVDGPIGDRLQALVVVGGSSCPAGTLVSVRGVAR
jgi:hypothetical protein